MAMLSEMGINVVDGEEAEEGETGGELVDTSSGSREVAIAGGPAETLDRTDDPEELPRPVLDDDTVAPAPPPRLGYED